MSGYISTPNDGRTRRALETRERIIAATIQLLGEGSINPSADDIAARARLGRRSVFRHFTDMEGLYREMHVQIRQRYAALATPFRSNEWREQLYELMDQRLAGYEELFPFKRAGDVLRHGSSNLQSGHLHWLSVMRDRLESILPAHVLVQRPLLDAIDLILSYDAWQRLRIEQRLSPADTRETIALLLSKLLFGTVMGASSSKD